MSKFFETQKCIVGLLTCFKLANLSSKEIADELVDFDSKTRDMFYQMAFNNGEPELSLLIKEANKIIDETSRQVSATKTLR